MSEIRKLRQEISLVDVPINHKTHSCQVPDEIFERKMMKEMEGVSP